MYGTHDILHEYLLFVITIPLCHSKSPNILEFEATLFWLRVQRNKIHGGWIVTQREKFTAYSYRDAVGTGHRVYPSAGSQAT